MHDECVLTLGSIIVNFEIVASDDVTAAHLSSAYQDLVVFLERGLLRLVKTFDSFE
jgi:hypothetical protein